MISTKRFACIRFAIASSMALVMLWFGASCSYDSDALGSVACESSQDCPTGAECIDDYCVFADDAGFDIGPDTDDCPGENELLCDGVCVDSSTDPDHCGECGNDCHFSPDGAEPFCDDGTCNWDCVDEDHTACSGECVDFDSHVDHCGGCHEACEVEGGTPMCDGGVCTVDECDEELADCSDETPEGEFLCADLDDDPAHCGECGFDCADDIDIPDHAVAVCDDGDCDWECQQGYWNCAGECVSEDDNFDVCDGECIDLDASHAHCGGCDDACSDAHVCSAGNCVEDCPGNQTACDGACVDTTTDADHCGGCGIPCTGDDDICHNSHCVECIDDGNCGDDESCVGGVCECDPLDCTGVECGPISNACSSEYCGDCSGGDVCDEQANQCVECVDDSHCGDPELYGCIDNSCSECSDPRSVETVCDDEGIDCGEATDGCNETVPCDLCTGTEDICDDTIPQCVECIINDDCTDGVCDDNQCVECVDHDDCGGEFCDEAHNECVECVDDSHCGDPTLYDCVDNACSECSDPRSVDTICDDEGVVCGEATDDCNETVPCNLCTGTENVCDPGTEQCVECIDNDHCTDGVCDDNQCVDCTDNDDCTDGVCDEGTNQCVECVEDIDCSGTDVCTSNQCVADCDPDHDTAGEYGGGAGTDDDPYLVCAVTHLAYLADENVQASDDYFLMTTDVTFDSDETFEPFGHQVHGFSGHFDGGGHEIQDLHIDGTGVFHELNPNGAIENLVITAVDVDGTGIDEVGGLTGQSHGTITNVSVDGVVIGGDDVGGLVGLHRGGAISASSAHVDVDGNDEVGGLVGRARGATITDSYATGSAEGDGPVGGVVGFIDNGAQVSECYASTAVSYDDTAGGVAGELHNNATLEHCYWDEDTTNMGTTGVGDSGTQVPAIEGLNTGQFDTEGNFDFDFIDIWTIGTAPDGEERPVLQWQE